MTKRARDQADLLAHEKLAHFVSRRSEHRERRSMHPRSRHNARDDFQALSRAFPVLKKHMVLNLKWKPNMLKSLMYHYDFTHPDAVYHLSKAILKNTYGLNLYLPCACPNSACDPFLQGEYGEEDSDMAADRGHDTDLQRYLAPCVPGRANYVHHAADLLHLANNLAHATAEDIDAAKHDTAAVKREAIPRGEAVKVLDVGTGANCIYPLLGVAEYGWSFIASDIDKEALDFAKHNVKLNQFSSLVELRHQKDPLRMFGGVLAPTDFVHLTMCNPPFHASVEQTNLNPRTSTSGTTNELVFAHKNVSTFSIDASGASGAQDARKQRFHVKGQVNYTFSNDVAERGELAFLEIMLVESRFYVQNVLWFTSLVAKLSTLKRIKSHIQAEMRLYNADNAKQVAFIDARVEEILKKANDHGDEVSHIQVSHLHACEFRIFTLNQGKQTRWVIAWTYYNAAQRFKALKKLYN